MKQLFHIGSEDNEERAQQLLSVRVGEKHCGFALTDKTGANLYQLVYYSIEDPLINPLAELQQKHPQLSDHFYKVAVSFDYPQSLVVPQQHFKQEETGSLLKNLYGVNGLHTVISEPVSSWQVYNIYAVPKELHEWLGKRFESGSYWHQYTLDINNLDASTAGDRLLVDFRKDDFTLVASTGDKLLLTRSFAYSTPEDVLYYLLKVCQEFGFSQQEVQLSISGLIDKQSSLYRDLYQYFIQISFREAEWTVPANEFPSHFFTSFNDLARCAS